MSPDKREVTLSVVAPVFNEATGVDRFVEEVREALGGLDLNGRWELVLVDDGSTDGTAERLDAIAGTYADDTLVLHLSRNFGHAAAVLAGLEHASGAATIVMDADLQDDPAAFPAFLAKWREGYDVVYAVRAARRESRLTRALFWAFYRVLSWTANTPLPHDAGSYALMSRRVVEAICRMKERNRYLPGLRAWVGFRQTGIRVARRGRYDRRSRVGLRGLWKLAMDAVFSFSYVPIFVFRVLGAVSMLIAVGLMGYALFQKLITGTAVKAWASQFIAIAFFGGINLFGLGVLGEYIARIYDEVKGRPTYVLDRAVGFRADEMTPR